MRGLLAPSQMGADELQRHIVGTYQYLRIIIAVIGFLLPIVLYAGGRIGSGVCLQDSLSAYYFATPHGKERDWFVGSLFAVGVLLLTYKGYTRKEDWLLNIAGLLCAGIALFPMTWHESSFRLCDGTHASPGTLPTQLFNPHGFFAVGFFACIAFVCWFCADSTLSLLDVIPGRIDRKKLLQRVYKAIAMAMVISIATAYFYHTWRHDSRRTFAVEVVGIMSFVLYWVVKSWEMSQTQADFKAANAQVGITDGQAAGVEQGEKPG